jgi:sugar phosphate isomerase/epimerase
MKNKISHIASIIVITLVLFVNIGYAQPPVPTETLKSIFDGKTLNGWEQIQGTAKFEVIDGMIMGTTAPNSPNSFLATKKRYGDFVMELDFKVDEELNSGIQFRSNQDKNYKDGIVHGYQVEIDPTQKELYSKEPRNLLKNGEVIPPATEPRNWTGGIYDEKRRGWLNDLSHNEEARKAFKPGEWNHLRIEATGYRIYTWINGVLASALFDDMTSSGFIALQVHATKEKTPLHVYWKNINIQDLSVNTPALNKHNQDLNKKHTNSSVKTSLNAFSFGKKLKKDWTFIDMIDYAAEQGFDAVDLTGYYFPGYPEVPTDDYIFDLKLHAHKMGIGISGTGVQNDMADPDPEVRAKHIKHIKEYIEVAAKLGAPVLRVFSGPIPKGYENKWDEVAAWMAKDFKECADYAAKYGVIIGIQNHGDMLSTADQTIKLVKMVDSKWFGVIVDTGYFTTDDPYIDIEKVMPYAVNFQVKESPFGVLSRVRIDMPRLIRIINNSGYRGYLPIETLGDKVMKTQKKPDYPSRPYNAEKMVPALLKELKASIEAEYKKN